jgi:hypothetical protein
MHTNILNKNMHQFMQFKTDTSYRSRYQVNNKQAKNKRLMHLSNKYNFRHQDKAVLPRVRTTMYGLNSFRYNAAQIWNELPNHFRQETSLIDKLQKQIPTEQKQAKNKASAFFMI